MEMASATVFRFKGLDGARRGRGIVLLVLRDFRIMPRWSRLFTSQLPLQAISRCLRMLVADLQTQA